jgi:hypothetical protein
MYDSTRSRCRAIASGPISDDASNGFPTFTVLNRLASASTKWSCRLRPTISRVSDEQTCPVRKRALCAMDAAAVSRS